MKKLILTEKPSVAKDIASALGAKSSQAKKGYFEIDDTYITWLWVIWWK
jgi:DNA topoisomerase IA